MSGNTSSSQEFQLSEENYELFSQYFKTTDREEIFQHVKQVREKALKVFKFFIVQKFKLLRMKTHPFYPSLLTLNKKREDLKVLDLGCCFGADLRKLIIDGFSAENLTGLDISSDFIQLGYELFKDQESAGIQFIVADILSEGWSEKVAGLEFDAIYLGSFLHLFQQQQQEKILYRVSQLLKTNGILFGKNLGSGSNEPTYFKGSELNQEIFLPTPNLFAKNLKVLGFGDIDVVAVPKEQLEDFQGGDPVGPDHPFLIYTAIKNGNSEAK